MNGDTSDSLEFTITLRKHPKEELLLYYIMERLFIPYVSGAYGDTAFEPLYKKVLQEWFADEGFPLSENEKDLAYFRQLYKKYTGEEFKLERTITIEKFDYINPNCHFCEIGRTSKTVRDSILLTKLDAALDNYDRVFVTFGNGHALALEPALKQLIEEERP